MNNFIRRVDELNGPGVLVAADMAWKKMQPTVDEIGDSEKVFGFKVGYITAFREHGADVIREILDRGAVPVIDLQKLGADVPFIIKQQTQEAIDAGAEAIIYDAFKDGCELEGAPHAFAVVETARAAGIPTIPVIHMTNEKGHSYERIRDRMYRNMLNAGVDFDYIVLPGNQLDVTRKWLNNLVRDGYHSKVVGPGIGKQGGLPEDACELVDIMVVGRAINGAEDKLAALNDIFDKGMIGYQKRSVK